jgi:hypothetical protein
VRTAWVICLVAVLVVVMLTSVVVSGWGRTGGPSKADTVWVQSTPTPSPAPMPS